MTPVEQYNACLSLPGFIDDAAQRSAIARLDDLSRRLIAARDDEATLARRLKARLVGDRREMVKGLYMWGGVGRGKTFLMDLFYDCVPFPEKLRTHFHRFMHRVHRDLTRFSGRADPLRLVADGKDTQEIARELSYSERTVKNVLHDVTSRLQLKNRTHAVAYALRQGLI